MDSIKIEQLVKDRDFDLRLELLAGEGGLDRRVVSSRIQKPGLALSGFTEHIHKDRLQVFGNTEISYLATLRHDEALKRVRNLFQLPIACLIVTKNLAVEDWMKREASDARVPLLRTSHLSSTFIDNIERFLQDALTASTSVHRVLIDVIGVEEQKYAVLDVEVPLLVVPVRPGRNLTTIVEVAARNHLLKLQGHHSAKEFQEKLSREIAQATLTRGIGDEVE